VWASRRTRNARDFFVAGQGIGIVTLAIAAMASTLSGFAFVGGPGLVYSAGTGAVFIVLSASITNTMGAWVLARRLRLLGEARGLITVPDAIGARYRSPAAQGLSAIAILVAVVGYMATNFLALGLVIDAMFGTGLTLGIWIAMLVTLSYTAAGGILAGVYTDLFEGVVKTVASVTVFYFVLQVGAAGSTASRAQSPRWTRRSSGRGGRCRCSPRCPSSSCLGSARSVSRTWPTSSTCCATRGS